METVDGSGIAVRFEESSLTRAETDDGARRLAGGRPRGRAGGSRGWRV